MNSERLFPVKKETATDDTVMMLLKLLQISYIFAAISSVDINFVAGIDCPDSDSFMAEYDNHCYIFVNTAASTKNAEEECMAIQGHLVWILSTKENSWLLSHEPYQGITNYIIGLRQGKRYSSKYMWTSGDEVEYLMLDNQQPQESNTSTCFRINMANSTWEPNRCHSALPFICKVAGSSRNDGMPSCEIMLAVLAGAGGPMNNFVVYTKFEDITVTAEAFINCSEQWEHVSLFYDWKLYRTDGSPVNLSGHTNTSELKIPQNTLDYGNYSVQLLIKAMSGAVEVDLQNASRWFTVEESLPSCEITLAVLAGAGVPMNNFVVYTNLEDITVTAEASVNCTEQSEHVSLSYDWKLYRTDGSPVNLSGHTNTSELKIPQNTLDYGNYSVQLLIKAMSGAVEVDLQNASRWFTVEESLPSCEITLAVLAGAGVPMNNFVVYTNFEDITVTAEASVNCTEQSEHVSLSYDWKLYRTDGSPVNLSGHTNTSELKIPQNTLDYGNYSVQLLIKAMSGAVEVDLQNASRWFTVEESLPSCEITLAVLAGAGVPMNNFVVYTNFEDITVTAEASVNCTEQSEHVSLSYDWKLYRTDGSPVNLSGHTNTSELKIPQNTLDYGNYSVQLLIKAMSGAVEVDLQNASHWFTVEESLLHPSLLAESDTVGLQDTLNLDASASSDPELQDDHLNFTWTCYSEGENLPEAFEDVLALTLGADQGGCFGDGRRLEGADSIWQAQASLLKYAELPALYTFRVYVSKPGREPVYTEKIVTLVTSLLQIQIVCIENCDTFLNASQQLHLEATCTNCGEEEALTYLWGFSPGSHLLGKTSIDWETDTLTGQHGYSLVVKEDQFPTDVALTYTFNVTVSRGVSSLNTASYPVSINSPLTTGQCTVSPTEGAALQTEFVVSCSEFSDTDQPLTYTMYLVVGTTEHLLYSGSDSSSPGMFLPQGSESQNYTLTINMVVADSYGLAVSVQTTVRVSPAQVDTQDLISLTSGESSELQQLVTNGDSQATTQFIDTVSSVLNAKASENTDLSAEQQQQEQEARTQVRQSLVESLVQVEVTSMDVLQQSTTVLTQVTSVPEELTTTAQSSASKALLETSDFLSSQSESASVSELEEGGVLLVSGISNIIEAAVMTETQSTAEQGESEQESQNRNVTLTCLQALDQVKDTLLKNKEPGDSATVISSETLSINLKKELAEDLSGAEYEVQGTFTGQTPKLVFPQDFAVAGVGVEVDSEFVSFKTNPFLWSTTSSEVTSAVSQIVFRVNQSEMYVENLSEPISIYLPQSESSVGEFTAAPLFTNQTTFLELTKTDEVTTVMLEMKLNGSVEVSGVEEDSIQVSLYYNVTGNYTEKLTTNSTANSSSTQLQPVYEAEVRIRDLPAIKLLGPDVLEDEGEYVVKLRLVSVAETTPLLVRMSQTKCLYWEEGEEMWRHGGCEVGSESTSSLLHCLCTHLTSFGAGLLVMPNKLNLKEDITMFLRFWQNPIGIIAVCSVLGLYIFLAVWARRKDTLDEIKALPVDLIDNDPEAEYQLLVTVYTGSRRGAGTTSKVCLVIQGSSGDTEPHLLECKEYPTLQRGDLNFFLVRTDTSPGEILSVRLWHNNSGGNPPWFVSRMLVYDPQTGQTYYFVCNCWLAVDLGDGILDQTFSVATKEDIQQFEHLFVTHANSGLCDRHLWFSVVSRPAFSTFTRVQRLSCCLSLILAYMLTNIMFYGVDKEPGEQEMDLGPFSISWTEIRIGFQSLLLMVPVNLLIVWLFRNIQPRHKRHTLHEKLTFDMQNMVEGLTSPASVQSLKLVKRSVSESKAESTVPGGEELIKEKAGNTQGEDEESLDVQVRTDPALPCESMYSVSTQSDWGFSLVSLYTDHSRSHKAGHPPHMTDSGLYSDTLLPEASQPNKRGPDTLAHTHGFTVEHNSGPDESVPRDSVKTASPVALGKIGSKLSAFDKGLSGQFTGLQTDVSCKQFPSDQVPSQRIGPESAAISAEQGLLATTVGSVNNEPEEDSTQTAQTSVEESVMEQEFESFASLATTTSESWHSHRSVSERESVSDVNSREVVRERDGDTSNNNNKVTNGVRQGMYTGEPQQSTTRGAEIVVGDVLDSDMGASSNRVYPRVRDRNWNTRNSNNMVTHPSTTKDAKVVTDPMSVDDMGASSDGSVFPEGSGVSLAGIQPSFYSVIHEHTSMLSTLSAVPSSGASSSASSLTQPLDPDTATVEVLSNSTISDSQDVQSKKGCARRLLPFPWWCVMFAWLLLATVSFVCGFFTILYTFNYGMDKSFKWLRSLIGSFLGDILLEQPLKVVALALFFSLVIKRTDTDDLDVNLSSDKETLDPAVKQRWKSYLECVKRYSTYRPPPQMSVTAAKKRREIERRMYGVLSEILRYLIFMYLVTLLAYAQRDNNLYYMNKLTEDTFFVAPTHSGLFLDNVTYTEDLWSWVKDVAVKNLYAEEPDGSMGFMAGRAFLGEPVLRQYRVRRVACDVHRLLYGTRCWKGYNEELEDTLGYGTDWKEKDINTGSNTGSAWLYSSADHYPNIAGYLSNYHQAGYVASLGKTLTGANDTVEALASGSWLDEGTAAVVLEFIVYTASVNLATSVQVLFEFTSTGGIMTKSSLHSMRLYRSTHGFHIFVLVFELIYLAWTLYFMVQEVRALNRLRLSYFRNPGCVLDLCGCLLSVLVISLYITHTVLVKGVTGSHKEGGGVYRAFGQVTSLDIWVTYILSFIVVIGMLKFLHLLRFNPLIYKFMSILRYGAPKLVVAGLLILILIGSFGHMMYLSAGKQLQSFSTWRLAILKLFVNMLGKMSSDQFQSYSDVVIGPPVVILFLLGLVVFLFNILIVVLIDALEYVNRFPQPLEDAELLWLLVDKFVQWLGIRRTKQELS